MSSSQTRSLRSRLRYQILLFTIIRTLLNTMHRMVYPFLPAFSRGLGVERVAISQALAARSFLGGLSPFLATLADSYGRKAGILIGLTVFAAGITVVVFVPTFPIFVIALLLAATGKYLVDPSIYAYLGDRIEYNRRGLAVAVAELGWSFSFVFGMPVVGFLIARGGWIAPFPLLGILSVIFLGGVAWFLPSDAVERKERPGIWKNLREVLTYLPAVAALTMGFLMSAANEIVNLMFGVWLDESFGLQVIALGGASLVIGLAELGGESLVGFLTDRLGKKRSVGIGLVVNCFAALLLPLFGQSVPSALVGLFIFYITFEFTLVSSIPIMTEIVPSARATLLSVNVAAFSFGRAFSALLANPVYEWGFFANILASMIFNLLALLALRWVVIEVEI